MDRICLLTVIYLIASILQLQARSVREMSSPEIKSNTLDKYRGEPLSPNNWVAWYQRFIEDEKWEYFTAHKSYRWLTQDPVEEISTTTLQTYRQAQAQLLLNGKDDEASKMETQAEKLKEELEDLSRRMFNFIWNKAISQKSRDLVNRLKKSQFKKARNLGNVASLMRILENTHSSMSTDVGVAYNNIEENLKSLVLQKMSGLTIHIERWTLGLDALYEAKKDKDGVAVGTKEAFLKDKSIIEWFVKSLPMIVAQWQQDILPSLKEENMSIIEIMENLEDWYEKKLEFARQKGYKEILTPVLSRNSQVSDSAYYSAGDDSFFDSDGSGRSDTSNRKHHSQRKAAKSSRGKFRSRSPDRTSKRHSRDSSQDSGDRRGRRGRGRERSNSRSSRGSDSSVEGGARLSVRFNEMKVNEKRSSRSDREEHQSRRSPRDRSPSASKTMHPSAGKSKGSPPCGFCQVLKDEGLRVRPQTHASSECRFKKKALQGKASGSDKAYTAVGREDQSFEDFVNNGGAQRSSISFNDSCHLCLDYGSESDEEEEETRVPRAASIFDDTSASSSQPQYLDQLPVSNFHDELIASQPGDPVKLQRLAAELREVIPPTFFPEPESVIGELEAEKDGVSVKSSKRLKKRDAKATSALARELEFQKAAQQKQYATSKAKAKESKEDASEDQSTSGNLPLEADEESLGVPPGLPAPKSSSSKARPQVKKPKSRNPPPNRGKASCSDTSSRDAEMHALTDDLRRNLLHRIQAAQRSTTLGLDERLRHYSELSASVAQMREVASAFESAMCGENLSYLFEAFSRAENFLARARLFLRDHEGHTPEEIFARYPRRADGRAANRDEEEDEVVDSNQVFNPGGNSPEEAFPATEEGTCSREIILDSGCTAHLFNKILMFMFENVEALPNPRVFDGISGSVIADKGAQSDFIGEVVFSDKALKNLISLAKLEDEEYRIVIYKGVVTCRKPGREIVFQRQGNLYFLKSMKKVDFSYPTEDSDDQADTANPAVQYYSSPEFQNVVKNPERWTRAQIEGALAYRHMHLHCCCMARNHELEQMRRGAWANCGFTLGDITRSDEILYPCPVCAATKVRRKRKLVIARRPRSIIIGECMHVDYFFLQTESGLRPYLIFVDEASNRVKIYRVRTRQKNYFITAMERNNAFYVRIGKSKCKIIVSDREKTFKSAQLLFEGCTNEGPPAGEKDDLSERFIRVIKSIIRTLTATLPYRFPEKALDYAVEESEDMLGLRPCHKLGGVSYFEGVDGFKFDMSRLFCRYGAYGLAQTPSTKRQNRAGQLAGVYGILVRREYKDQPAYTVMLLDPIQGHNSHFVTVSVFTPIVPGPEIIEKINRLSDSTFPVEEYIDNLLGGDYSEDAYVDHEPDEAEETEPNQQDQNSIQQNDAQEPLSLRTELGSAAPLGPVKDAPSLPIEPQDVPRSRAETLSSVKLNLHPEFESPRPVIGSSKKPPDRTKTPAKLASPRKSPERPPESNPIKPEVEIKIEPTEVKASTRRKSAGKAPPPPPREKLDRAAKRISIGERQAESGFEYSIPKVQTRIKPEPLTLDPAREKSKKMFEQALSCVEHLDLEEAYQAIEPVMQFAFSVNQKMSNMSIAKAFKRHKTHAELSVRAEVKQILDRDTFTPKYWKDLTPEQRKKVIISFTFLKKKKDVDGNLVKLKARLVAGGHMLDASLLGDISSPTIKTDSVTLLFALAARKAWKVSCKDITGAYLNTKLNEGDEQYMRLGPEEVKALLLEKPDWAPYVRKDGSMLVQLNGGLYGLPQAAKLWYDMLSKTLISLGYTKSMMDDCVFIKHGKKGAISIVGVHVDDILHCFSSDHFDVELNQGLTKQYGDLTLQNGDSGIYVGIEYSFNRVDKSVKLTMIKYLKQLMSDYKVEGTSPSPCNKNLMEPDTEKAKPCSKTTYLSLVMALYFAAARVRPDILFVVNYLSTRGNCCTNEDYSNAFRVLKYLNGTLEAGLLLRPSGTRIHFYVDASYSIHPDGRSHTGYVFSLGGDTPSLGLDGAISSGTSVQRFITVSSTEAEMAAVFSLHQLFEFYRIMLEELKVSTGLPILVMQDNQAAIINFENGFKGRTKPINVRYNYIRELVLDKKVKLLKIDTKDMIADPLTKPFYHSASHVQLLQRLLNDLEYFSSNERKITKAAQKSKFVSRVGGEL